MRITRKKTRQIQVGSVKIGGGAPITVQSMTVPHPSDVQGTVEQIHQMEEVGCELVRVAVPDQDAVEALPKIKARISIPLIADVHFDHRLALKAAEVVDCVRINPGNIGPWWRLAEVIKAVQDRGIPPSGWRQRRFVGASTVGEVRVSHGRGLVGIGVECRPRH